MAGDINRELAEVLRREGAEEVYCVDITHLPEEMSRGYPRALLLVNRVPVTEGKVLEDSFGEKERQTDLLAEWAERYLEGLGYRAFGQSERRNEEADCFDGDAVSATLPHKTIALLAGLGWIGKNDVLVTHDKGSALSMCTALTDAPLETWNSPVMRSRCGECTVCRDICPEKAITGSEWEPGLDRAGLLDVKACTFCYLCVSQCPWTLDYARRTK